MKINKGQLKQIFLIVLAFGLIFLGYSNTNLEKTKAEKDDAISIASSVNETNLGDVQLVSSESIEPEYKTDLVSNDDLEAEEQMQTVEERNYFEETRIEREKMYSEMIETYTNLIESNQTPVDQKAISVQEISNLTNNKNGIMIAENLIKNKGFEDVIVFVNNATVSVVVKAYTLSKEEISKIQNIIQRELNVSADKINISHKY